MIRELHRTKDRKGVEAIDTAFETSSVFDMVTTPRSIELVERTLETPLVKRYSIGEVFAQWASWDRGWVYELCGADRFLYGPYMPGETALYLAKVISG